MEGGFSLLQHLQLFPTSGHISRAQQEGVWVGLIRVRTKGVAAGELERGTGSVSGTAGTQLCGEVPTGHGWLLSPAPALDPAPLSPLQVGKLRERLQEAKLEREQEQRRHTAYLSALRAKLHEEKTKELQALREALIRQHEQEAARTAKIKEGELQRLQATLNVLRDGAADKVKTALLAEAREEARRSFDGERLRLQQEVLEQKAARKQAEEALSHCVQADKAKAADLRAAYQEHQDEVHRIKRECERDIRRLVRGRPARRLARPFQPRALPLLPAVNSQPRGHCAPGSALAQGFPRRPRRRGVGGRRCRRVPSS